jgi:hypothetical protein
MSKTSDEAWLSIPEKQRTAIVDFAVKAERGSLVLEGICKKCQSAVVRVID